MVTMLQKDGQNVTAEDDAIFYNALATNQCGIIKDCDISINSENNIAIKDGYILVSGRIIKLSGVVLVAEKPGSENVETGYIYVQIDLTDAENPAKVLTAINKTQFDGSDINYNGTIYEYPIGKYTANSVSVLTVESIAARAGRTPAFDRITLEGNMIIWVNKKVRFSIEKDGTIRQYDEAGTLRTQIQNGGISLYDSSGNKRIHCCDGEQLLYDNKGVRRTRVATNEIALYNEKGNAKAVLSQERIWFYNDDGSVNRSV